MAKVSLNRAQKKQLAKIQLENSKQLGHARREHVRHEKEEFLKKTPVQKVRFFYSTIPSKKAKVVFWIWSIPIFLVMLPVRAFVNFIKIDIAWKWSQQLLFSFINGK